MLKILDILINALVAWRSRIVINRQKQDLCCLEGKENPADVGFESTNERVLLFVADSKMPNVRIDPEAFEIMKKRKKPKPGNEGWKAILSKENMEVQRMVNEIAEITDRPCLIYPKAMNDDQCQEPVYFPGLTQKEIEALVKK
jgi:hypothetical protein